MIDTMDNKQVCAAIYGCADKLVSLSNKLSRFYTDHSKVCSVRNMFNAHYHQHNGMIKNKDAAVVINNEMTRESYSISSDDLRVALTISAYRPMCMRSLVVNGGSTIPAMQKKLAEFKMWLTDELSLQYESFELDKLSNKLMMLYSGGYSFDTEVDEDFFCVSFQSNKNKSTITLAIEVI